MPQPITQQPPAWAMRLRSQAGYLYFLLLGRAYYFLGDTEQARINLNEALTRNAVNLEAHLYLAATAPEKISGFDWDDGNSRKNEKYVVSMTEV